MSAFPHSKFDGVPSEPLDLGELTPVPVPRRWPDDDPRRTCPACGSLKRLRGGLWPAHDMVNALGGKGACPRSGTVA